MTDKQPVFKNMQDEIDYWRTRCEDKEKELSELEESFTDFQQSSKELEAEMERELTTTEKKLKDMTSMYHRLKSEHDEMTDKSRRMADDSGKMIHNLQEEAEALKKSNKDLRREKQRLEQENDELERRVRESEASLQDLSEKMNKTLEENSFLQTELEETKNRSQESIQRMKDEIRDLQLELELSEQNKVLTEPVVEHKQNGVVSPEPQTAVPLLRAPSPSSLSLNNKTLRSVFSEGSIELVDDILLLVKDMERKLLSQKVEARAEKASRHISWGDDSVEEY